MGKDLYEVLGVRPGAQPQEIELAFKGRRSQYHPDRYAKVGQDSVDWATRKMQEVNEAYGILSDPESRARYDRSRNARPGTQGRAGASQSNAAGQEQAREQPRPRPAPEPAAARSDAGNGRTDRPAPAQATSSPEADANAALAFLGLYVVLILVFAVYGNFWGDYAYKGALWNLGRGVIWPVTVGLFVIDAVWTLVKYVLGVVAALVFLYFLLSRR